MCDGAQSARLHTRSSRLPNVYPKETLADLRNPALATFIDMCRWLAASIVFLGHLRDPLFQGYSRIEPAARGVFVNIWYLITGLHAEAVLVFFVLSGYLVGGSAAAAVHAGRFSPIDYLINRCTRIFLPFWPALVMTALLDWIGTNHFGNAGLYSGQQAMLAEKIKSGPFADASGVDTFVLNALMQQEIHAPAFGSNLPLWTISLEFWFYIMFGLFLLLAVARSVQSRNTRAAIGWGVAIASLALWLQLSFFVYFGLWLIGVAVAFLPWRAAERPLLALSVFGVVLLGVRFGQDFTRGSDVLRTTKDYGVAIAFAWLLLSMRHIAWAPPAWLARVNAAMASFSYSLYLVHFPVLIFVLSALYASGAFPGIASGYQPNDLRGLAAYLIVIVAGFAVARLLALATEDQTGRARRALKALYVGASRAAGADSEKAGK